MKVNSDPTPLISIIIAYHNSAPTIVNTLLSLNTSAYHLNPPSPVDAIVEVVCVDNASTDRGRERIEKLFTTSNSHSLIKFVHAEEPRKGVGHARNRGVLVSTGLYIGFIDADDVVKPLYLQYILDAISNKPDIIHLELVSNNYSNPTITLEPPMAVETFVQKHLKGWWCWSFILRRELFEGFPFQGTCYEDITLFPLILSKAKNVVHITGKIYCYATSLDSLTKQPSTWRLMQWESQFHLLSLNRMQLLPVLQRRMNREYVHQKIVLRSEAGLPIVSGITEAIVFLRSATTLEHLVHLSWQLSKAIVIDFLKTKLHCFRY